MLCCPNHFHQYRYITNFTKFFWTLDVRQDPMKSLSSVCSSVRPSLCPSLCLLVSIVKFLFLSFSVFSMKCKLLQQNIKQSEMGIVNQKLLLELHGYADFISCVLPMYTSTLIVICW